MDRSNTQTTLALGLKDAADALGLSHWTLRSYVKQGKLAAVRIGKRILIEPSALQQLIEKGRQAKKENQ